MHLWHFIICFLYCVQKLKEYFPIAEVGLLQEDSSNILQVMETAFTVTPRCCWRFVHRSVHLCVLMAARASVLSEYPC